MITSPDMIIASWKDLAQRAELAHLTASQIQRAYTRARHAAGVQRGQKITLRDFWRSFAPSMLKP